MDNPFLIEQLSPLYEAVQTSGIFPDSKSFPDCTLLATPEVILSAYAEAVEQPNFDLKSFVNAHFSIPPPIVSDYQSGDKPIAEHLEALWSVLLRQPDAPDAPDTTLIPLPFPYIVPGGRFREVYYWDSYFTMLGLRAAGRHELIHDITGNFAHLIDTVGFVPNGNRTYYLSRSQPPFFALMVNLLSDIKGPEIRHQYRPQLEREYAFWMAGELTLSEEKQTHRRVVRLPDGAVLNRYWDDRPMPRPEAYAEDIHLAGLSDRPAEETWRHIRAAAESGWDFSSRWLADGQNMATIRTTELIPVDLNCLLYYLEKTLLSIYRELPDRVPADVMKLRAKARKNAIQQYCWNNTQNYYFDYSVPEQFFTKSWHLAAVYPLFFDIATPEQAAHVAQHIAKKFLQPGGLITTLEVTGQQWDAPNGWAPLQWMTYCGLRQYGYEALANQVRTNWLRQNEKTYAATGKMMEKYNVTDINLHAGGGEYPNQDGFGWTNGVYLAMQ
jgi:alpha,alpha-trehalase